MWVLYSQSRENTLIAPSHYHLTTGNIYSAQLGLWRTTSSCTGDLAITVGILKWMEYKTFAVRKHICFVWFVIEKTKQSSWLSCACVRIQNAIHDAILSNGIYCLQFYDCLAVVSFITEEHSERISLCHPRELTKQWKLPARARQCSRSVTIWANWKDHQRRWALLGYCWHLSDQITEHINDWPRKNNHSTFTWFQ